MCRPSRSFFGRPVTAGSEGCRWLHDAHRGRHDDNNSAPSSSSSDRVDVVSVAATIRAARVPHHSLLEWQGRRHSSSHTPHPVLLGLRSWSRRRPDHRSRGGHTEYRRSVNGILRGGYEAVMDLRHSPTARSPSPMARCRSVLSDSAIRGGGVHPDDRGGAPEAEAPSEATSMRKRHL